MSTPIGILGILETSPRDILMATRPGDMVKEAGGRRTKMDGTGTGRMLTQLREPLSCHMSFRQLLVQCWLQ